MALFAVMRSDFARPRRMTTAKRAMAELRPARAIPMMARNRMARRTRIMNLVGYKDIVELQGQVII